MNIEFYYKSRPVLFFKPTTKALKKKEDIAKFQRLTKLVRNWKSYERRLLRDLNCQGSREAYVCLLMAYYGVRIGNKESAEGYVAKMEHVKGETVQTFGCTTLTKEHVQEEDNRLILNFLGKKAVDQSIVVTDPHLVKWGKAFLRDRKTDKFINCTEYAVRRYLRKIDNELVVKDFRALCANAHAWMMFEDYFKYKEKVARKSVANAEVKTLCEMLAKFMGNTAGVCRRSYLSPILIEYVAQERMK